MTFKPPASRFEGLIKSFLDNVQATNNQIATRFAQQDQRDFQREQYQTQRTDFVADREWSRENQLTDAARSLNQQRADTIGQYLWAVDEDDPNFQLYLDLVTQLGTPSTLRGDAAMQEAMNRRFIDASGAEQSVDVITGRLKANADTRMRDANWLDKYVTETLEIVGNTAVDAEVRARRVNSLRSMRKNGLTDDMFDMLLTAAGIEDPDLRLNIKNGQVMDAQTILANQHNITGQVIANQAAGYDLAERVANRPYRDEKLQLDLREHYQRLGMNDAQMFLEAGVLPTDEDALARLALSLTGGDIDALRLQGEGIFNRRMRQDVAATRSVERSVELLGVQIGRERLDKAIAEYEFDRDKANELLNKRVDMATLLGAAAARGDVSFIREMEALRENYPDTFYATDFASLLELASEVQGDDKDIRDRAADARAQAATRDAFVTAAGIDDYIDKYAAEFLPLFTDANYDVDSGTYPEFEAALDEWLDNVAPANVRGLGVTPEEFKERMLARVKRLRAVQDYSESGQALDALLKYPPSPRDQAARNAWMAEVEKRVAQLGMDAGAWGVIAANIRDGNDLEFYTTEAKNRLDNQTADYYYQQTVGQWIDNATNSWKYDALTAAAPTFDVKTMSDLVSTYKSIVDANAVTVGSDACKLASTEDARFGEQGGLAFVPTAQGNVCQAAFDRMTAAQRNMEALMSGFAIGADGARTFDPLASRDANGGVPPLSGASAADRSYPVSVITDYMSANGMDASSFDTAIYDMLPYAAQRGLASAIVSGEADPADAINTILGSLAISEGTVPRIPGLPTMAASGIDPASPEWLALPTEQRVEALRGTKDYQDFVADIAPAVRYMELYTAPGQDPLEALFNPTTDAQLQVYQSTFGLDTLPSEQLNAVAERFGFGRMVIPEEQPEGRGLGGFLGAPARQAGTTLGRYGDMLRAAGEWVGDVWTGNQDARSPAEIGQERRQQFMDSGGELLAALAPDIENAIQRGADAMRVQLAAAKRLEDLERGVAEANATLDAASPRGLGTPPGPATPTGPGSAGSIEVPPLPGDVGQPVQVNRGVGGDVVEPVAPSPDSLATRLPERRAAYVGVADRIMQALITQESGGRHGSEGSDTGLITSRAGALGLTQLMWYTAAKPGYGLPALVPGYGDKTLAELKTPAMQREISAKMADIPEEEFARFGRDYLATMLHEFDGNLEHAIGSYNTGADNVHEAVKRAREAGDETNWLNYLPTKPEFKQQTIGYVTNIMAMLERSGALEGIGAPQPRDVSSGFTPRASVTPARGIPDPGFWTQVNSQRNQIIPLAPGGAEAPGEPKPVMRTGGRF